MSEPAERTTTNVRLENVSCRFGPAQVVNGINLEIKQGEFVSLLGPSGCGKTTTLRMIAGLQQNSGGRITIGDRLVSDADRGVFVAPEARRLGMVFQSYAIWPHMTVFENVSYPLQIRRVSKPEIERRVKEVLDLVELGGYAQRPAPALSGGQQQRVAIARALVFEPAVLLLDEPLSNLDAKLRDQMGGEFRALQQRLGITTVYVTHDQQEAMTLSDRIVVMHRGSILQDGAPEAIYDRPGSLQVAKFFGNPNCIPAALEGVEKAGDDCLMMNVRTRDGWAGRILGDRSCAGESEVVLVVRPEVLEVRRQAVSGGDVRADGWRGAVERARFHGAFRTLEIRSDDTVLQAIVPSHQAVAVGDLVELRPPLERIWAVPARA